MDKLLEIVFDLGCRFVCWFLDLLGSGMPGEDYE